MDHQELNRNTLRRAIGELPDYAPAEGVWEAIEAHLEQEGQDKQLRLATHQLPLYTPPPQAWDNILGELEEKPKVRKMWLRPAWGIAASLVGAIIAAGIWLYLREDAGTQIVMSHTEMMDITGFDADWNEDEEAIAMVVSLAEKMPDNDDLAGLKTELEELNEAKAMLTDAMEAYGKDAEMIRRLSKIERERSKIVKQMAAEI